MKRIKTFYSDKFLLFALVAVLAGHYAQIFTDSVDSFLLTFFASIATLPVIVSAYHSVKNKKISIDLLASIALLVSLLNKEWASAVFINLMLTSARIFADYTANRARFAIKSLLKLRPKKVKIKRGREIIEEPLSRIQIGDLIVIELGDRIPVDGIIVSGQALIDQSSLTGESIPVNKNVGDQVLSSTLNASGSVIIKAEKVGKDTMFEKIIKLVEESEKNKIDIQTIADKFTGWYIALIFLATLSIYFIFHSANLVLAVLLVTCADDIAVAIPMAFSAAIGDAARRGIIIKGGNFLEGLAKVKTVIVDKTGTITRGRLKVAEVAGFKGFSKDEVLKLGATADFFSTHPYAKAIVNQANLEKIKFGRASDFQEFPGKGIKAIWNKKKIICGSLPFFQENSVFITEKQLAEITSSEKEKTGSVLLVACNNELAGYIILEDEVRPEAKKAIADLKKLGIKNVVMLTGDNEKIAEKVAKETGIDIFHANLLPQDKLNFVKKYLNNKTKVAMIGDGVNDAASLSLADIGIAMGAVGSDVAIETADIALMRDDLSRVPEAIQLGIYVTKVAKQNFWIWGAVNLVGLVLVFGRVIGPEGAAGFNFITDFIPIANSLRLFRYHFSKVK